MKVSVITINFNNRDGLQRTLDSVLEQTTTDFEYILIDGGSTDGSRELIEAYADRLSHWVSEPDKGIYNAMNKGIRAARGEYCIFMNSGDSFYASDVLERTIPLLKGGDFYIGDQIDDTGKRYVQSPDRINVYLLVAAFYPHQASFIRTQILKARPYQEEYKIIADWEQMVYELLLNHRSYQHLNYTVALFDTTGISSQKDNQNAINMDKAAIINKLFSEPLRRLLMMSDSNRLEKKILLALNKKSAWARDWKILRNVLKSMFYNLFRITNPI